MGCKTIPLRGDGVALEVEAGQADSRVTDGGTGEARGSGA